MTVRELIEELEEYPMDLPVTDGTEEITEVNLAENIYYLNGYPQEYTYSAAVVLR